MALCYTCNFFNEIDISGQYYNHITIVNDNSCVVSKYNMFVIQEQVSIL
jgi:hypothetical protein